MNNKALELNESLKDIEEIKQYLKLKEIIKNDERINSLLSNINSIQNEMKEHLKNNEIKEYNKCKIILEEKKKEFNEDPLIVNYLNYKNETFNILEQIASILSDK